MDTDIAALFRQAREQAGLVVCAGRSQTGDRLMTDLERADAMMSDIYARNDGIPRIAQLFRADALTAKQLNHLLSSWWAPCEFPALAVGNRMAVCMFKAAGFVTDSPEDVDAEMRPLIRPKQDLVIYRGAAATRRFGLSWTTEFAVAAWFARRFQDLIQLPSGQLDPVAVYSATIPPRHILGMFDQRKESEVVVNPNGLYRRQIAIWSVNDPEVITASSWLVDQRRS